MGKTKILICPYCGETQPLGERCRACGGLFEPLSRQATHNAMGPWFVRNPFRPFQPGCSYETLVKMVERGQVIKTSIVRGPTSKQFWTAARRLPGIAHLLGYCHNCDASVDPGDHGCHNCGVPFGAYLDRNYLGLPEVKPLPWEAPIVEGAGGMLGQRGINWERAAEPMGLSSFASDHDMRGVGFTPASSSIPGGGQAMHGEASIASGQASATGLMQRASFGSTAKHSPAAAALELATSSAALRSMQRRVQQQRRTIHLMILAMVAVLVVSALVVVARLMSAADGGAENRAQPPSTQTAGKSPATDSAVVPTTTGPAATAPQIDLTDELRLVDELMAQAGQTDRALSDRIADYESAQRILNEIIAKTPQDQHPAVVAEKLRRVERELEQLKLQQFFP